jgi:hypothetical protein
VTELFAHMAAILHAYADQRANESFLRTATLTRSLIDLANCRPPACNGAWRQRAAGHRQAGAG